MTRVRTTVTLVEALLRPLKVRAARLGKGVSEVMEEALRRYIGLKFLDRLWTGKQMDEDSAAALAVEAQHRTRPRHSR
ncbi:ribbon-helix-helix domain-containing protein [Candidatus Nephthysia bennettiae]|uniref:Ribbon-helix-helix protein, CopG family n=1 Tax=Candidatus Nephthysia bennettiae TaxID=3127016 RepID=A0A934K2E0_9BACT|nr:ribbon-helix-helix protein, CopG family [Candidatus Dormibacteraeota bacterium]